MKRLYCKYCGSDELEYKGIDDGGGDDGDSLVDIFHCTNCDSEIEATGDYREVFSYETDDETEAQA